MRQGQRKTNYPPSAKVGGLIQIFDFPDFQVHHFSMEIKSEEEMAPGVKAESGADTAENSYQRYNKKKEEGGLGGIINERDYTNALAEAKDAETMDPTRTAQAKGMAGLAEIELNPEAARDPKVILYGILRKGVNTFGEKYHYSQMPDQRLFVEALRMLEAENPSSLNLDNIRKFIDKHSHMSFEYEKGKEENPT